MAACMNCALVWIFTIFIVNDIHSYPVPLSFYRVKWTIPVTEKGVAGLGPNCNHGAIEKIADAASNVLTGTADFVAKGIDELTISGTLLGPIGAAADTVGKAADDAFDDAVSGVNGAINAAACGIGDAALALISETNKDLIGGAEHAVGDVVIGVEDIGEDLAGGVVKAVDDVAVDLTHFIVHL